MYSVFVVVYLGVFWGGVFATLAVAEPINCWKADTIMMDSWLSPSCFTGNQRKYRDRKLLHSHVVPLEKTIHYVSIKQQ